MNTAPNSFRTQPDERGHFGQFGGRYVAETLMPLVLDLEREYRKAQQDPAFQAEFDDLLEHYVGRPSPLYFAPRLTEELGGAQVWFKRDELNHTGAHKINNCIGQILLAIRMGKTRIIAETGAGQHGVATATVCARFGLPCVIYMGATDIERQKVGTCYKQHGQQAAIELGHQLVSGKVKAERVEAWGREQGAEPDRLDGLTLTGEQLEGDTVGYWRANLRASNTEPLLRLNVEAKTADEVQAIVDEVLAIIRA